MLEFVCRTPEISVKHIYEALYVKAGFVDDVRSIKYCFMVISDYFYPFDLNRICKHYGLSLQTFYQYKRTLPSKTLYNKILKDIKHLCLYSLKYTTTINCTSKIIKE